jgi:FkbM family methyltransferase
MSLSSSKKYIAKYDDLYYLTNDYIFYESINNGNSEPYPKHLDIVKKYLKMFPHKNKTYIDIGTHIGSTIIPYSRLFDKVIGYEPQKDNYKFATHNIKLNNIKNAVIYPYGLFDKECKGIMKMNIGNNSGCYYFSPFPFPLKEEKEEGEVECKKLDEFENINIDFIKIDVHGSELMVLQGAKETIIKWKPLIQLETNVHAKNLYGIYNETTIDFLLNLGYRYFDNTDKLNPFLYFPNITLSISPKTIYTFWNGNYEMSENRICNLNCLRNVSQSNVILILEKDISNYILISEPLHPAFPYLSATHKSDYLRTYFMHFYGGGYSDIKKTNKTWINSFEEIEYSGENIIGCGYPEIGENGVAHPDYKSVWNYLIGNCAYIFKPNTEFTLEWYNTMMNLLDIKHDSLREYYVTNSGKIHPQASFEDGYPIGWNEMLGNIFHPLVYKYHTQILHILPGTEFINYR